MQMDKTTKERRINTYLLNAVVNGLPKDAYLQVGYACNGRCLMCDIWKTPILGDKMLLIDVVVKLARSGFEGITFWGGEPLLHPNIDELMYVSKQQGLSLQIITNGALIQQHMGAICDYVDNLVVSIDSGIPLVHDRIRGRENMYLKAVQGISSLLTQPTRPHLEIDCTILNENIHTLTSVVELSHQLGGVFIDFDPTQVYGVGNNRNYKLNAPAQGIDDAVLLAAEYDIEITSMEKIELIKAYLRHELILYPCYSYCKDLLINPFGEVHTCWTIGEIIGNILDESFQERWLNALQKNKFVLVGKKQECYRCGFSHSRMPDKGYNEIVKEANMIRLSKLH